MKHWLFIGVCIGVFILFAQAVSEYRALPVMEVDIETKACTGLRFPPDYELVSCVNIPDKYEVVWVHRKTCE